MRLGIRLRLRLVLGLGFIFYIYFVSTKPTALSVSRHTLLSCYRRQSNKASNLKIRRWFYSHCLNKKWQSCLFSYSSSVGSSVFAKSKSFK